MKQQVPRRLESPLVPSRPARPGPMIGHLQRHRVSAAWGVAVCLVMAAGLHAGDLWLSSLDLAPMTAGWGQARANQSITGKPLSIAGHRFEHGIGTHAASMLWIDLAGGSERLSAMVGVDDDVGTATGSVRFKVVGDGQVLWESGPMKTGDSARALDVGLRGVQKLVLLVGDAGDGTSYDHADWADARLVVTGATPKSVAVPPEPPVVLTPKPGPAPRLQGPAVYGCRPGHPFLYRIPATGVRPLRFSARGLPDGLVLDGASGIIRGVVVRRGEYRVTLRARNQHGTGRRSLTISCGDRLALTPPMGWNHWYAHYDRITDRMMRQAADAMIASGMADVGYQYVNIDDCWMNAPKNDDPLRVGPLRDDQGRILPNRHFPDMRALTEYIHSLGLKAGIYTSPGPFTCAGFCGAYQHEAQDAQQFAAWGFDFLKYDWCSYGDLVKGDDRLATLQKPYRQMGDLLRQQSRDIVLNLCQYGMGKVWEWGEEVGGHCWRTAGDLGFELNRIFPVALKNAEHRAFSHPGSWNDPDYLQIGYIGNASGMGMPRPCPLTPAEQYAFMSLWCLMASPLVYSGDMTRLDEFTLSVLCNPEVIAVDQDPLGQCARVIPVNEDVFLMVKDLVGGGKALGLCNAGEFETRVTARWAEVGVRGGQPVRDLWRQKDLGKFEREFTASVPRHGVVLVRVGRVSGGK